MVIPTMETVAMVDHIQILGSQVAVTDTVAQALHLELVMVEAVVALVVDLGADLVQAVVAPLGPIQAYSPLQLVLCHPVVEVAVVPATVPAAADMVEVLLVVAVLATHLVALEVEEGDMDPTAVEALPLDVEVEQGDI